MASVIPISITYDGGDFSHRESVVPALDQRGLKGTFYVEPTDVLDHLNFWQDVSGAGHEIGNGSMLGACLPDGSLPMWTLEMICEELESSSDLLADLFHAAPHSIGLPLGKAVCSDHPSYAEVLAQRCGRAVRSGFNGLNPVYPQGHLLSVIPMVGLSGTQMIEVVRNALAKESWAILAFYGVGSGDRSVDLAAHDELLDFLVLNSSSLKVEPVAQQMERVRLKTSFRVV